MQVKKNKYRLLISNILVFASGNALSKLILFLMMPLYTTALQPEQYSTAELANNTAELLIPIVSLCLGEAIFRFSINDDYDKGVLISESFFLIIKILAAICAAALLYQVIFYYRHMWYMVCIVSTYIFRQLFGQFTRGLGRSRAFAVGGIINTLTLCGFNVLFLIYFKWGVEGYLLSIILSSLLASLFFVFTSYAPKHISFKNKDKRLLKNMLVFSLPLIPTFTSWWVTFLTGRYTILWFSGAAAAGLYIAASKLPAVINLLSTTFNYAWQFSSSKEINEDKSGSFFSNVFKLYFCFITLATSALVLLSPFISKIFLRNDFYAGWVYIPMLLLTATTSCYASFFSAFYTASMKTRSYMNSTIAGAVVNAAVCLALVPFFGVYGALAAGFISYFLVTVFRMKDTEKYARVSFNLPVTGLCFFILTSQCVVMTFGSKLPIIVSGALFCVLAAIVLLFARREIIRGLKTITVRFRKSGLS